MKLYAKLGLPALLLAATLMLASCGGGGMQGMDERKDKPAGERMQGMDHGKKGESDGMSGMGDMEGMDHGPGGMASGMLMKNGKYSDDLFIDAMVPHHEGAVEMAEVALKIAEHEEIKQLSEDIISAQEAEIKELKSIKQEQFSTSKVTRGMNAEEMEGMGMMTDPRSLATKDPFDKAFIDNMIPHHQSAIEMARVAAAETENPRIEELAKNIVQAQEREISQMKQWRREWYPNG